MGSKEEVEAQLKRGHGSEAVLKLLNARKMYQTIRAPIYDTLTKQIASFTNLNGTLRLKQADLVSNMISNF